ncbi:MAG: hypothetical protein RL305_590 [Pseudomonadota bacterium]
MDIFLLVFPEILGLILIPTGITLLFFLAILLIFIISASDSALIKRISFLIAKSISSSVLPTPENTIFFGEMPAFKAIFNSPIETTSAPEPSFFNSEISFKFEFDFTEKQIIGLIFLKTFLKLLKLNFNWLKEYFYLLILR